MRRLWIALVAVGCAPAAPRTAPVVVRVAPSASASAIAAKPVAKMKLDLLLFPGGFEPRDVRAVGDRQLHVGSGGERWLAPKLEAAKQLAPEPLTAARQTESGWVFLGASGTVYAAKTPLGEFESQRPPPRPFRAVAAGKSAFVAVAESGDAFRSIDHGTTWSKASLPAWTSALALSSKGEGLAVSSPQSFVTLDDGATWAKTVTPVAPARLRIGKDDQVIAEGMGQVIPKGGAPRFGTRTAVLENGKLTLKDASPHRLRLPDDGPPLTHAEGIHEGHAALAGGRMLEPFMENDGDVSTWRLSSYELGSVPQTAPIPLPPSCLDALVDAGPASVVIACVREPDAEKANDKATLIVLRSLDRGATWTSEPALEPPGTLRRVRTIGKSGLMVANEEGWFVRAGNKLTRVVFDPPRLVEPEIDAIASSDDGTKVYAFVSIPRGEEAPAFMVSKDGGKKFVSKPLPVPEPDTTISEPPLWFGWQGAELVALVPYAGGLARVATKNEGGAFDVARFDLDPAYASLSGDRGLAITDAGGFETIDGGRVWTSVPMPTPRGKAHAFPVACTPQGCVLGDRGVRMGWQLESAADVKPWVNEAKPKAAKPPPPKTIACTATGKTAPVAGFEGGLVTDKLIFGAVKGSTSAKGGAAPVEVWVVEPASGDPKVRKLTLLPESAKSAGVSQLVNTTQDGVVAMRAAAAPGNVDVDIAFFDASTAKVTSVRLSKAAFFDGKKTKLEGQGVVVPGWGAWIRVSDSFYAVTAAGVATPHPRPTGMPNLSFTAVHANGSTFLFQTQTHGAHGLDGVVGVLDDAAKAFSPSFFALAPDAGGGATTTLFVAGGTAHLVVSTVASDAFPARGYAIRFDGKNSDPIALPTKFDAACTKDTGLAWDVGSYAAVTVGGKPQGGTVVTRVRDQGCIASTRVRGSEPILAIPGKPSVRVQRTAPAVMEAIGLTCALQ